MRGHFLVFRWEPEPRDLLGLRRIPLSRSYCFHGDSGSGHNSLTTPALGCSKRQERWSVQRTVSGTRSTSRVPVVPYVGPEVKGDREVLPSPWVNFSLYLSSSLVRVHVDKTALSRPVSSLLRGSAGHHRVGVLSFDLNVDSHFCG